MLTEDKIREYARLCMHAEGQETTQGKIRGLNKAREIIREDCAKVLDKSNHIEVWCKLWWSMVEGVHAKQYWRSDIGFVLQLDDIFSAHINTFEEILTWLGQMDLTPGKGRMTREDIGPANEFYTEFYPDIAAMMDCVASPDNEKWQPWERKPQVTAMDVVYCEILEMIDRRVEMLEKMLLVETASDSQNGEEPAEGEGATLLARGDYDGAKLLRVCRLLKQEGYLECKDEDWLYVWGVRSHPLSGEPLNPPAQPLVWSVEKGKKSALATTIDTLRDNQNCGKYWIKTARWFRYSDGQKPDPKTLKSQGLKGASETDFKNLILDA